MNTYSKFVPNVFLAKCTEKHEKGSVIPVTTKYGKENLSIVFNLIGVKDGFFYYSIVREDGFNFQEFARRKAEKHSVIAANAVANSEKFYQASQEGRAFLSLGEPIKIGHHSERRHRALIERNHNRMRKCVEMSKRAEDYESNSLYWEARTNDINLSMPESLEYYAFMLEKAQAKHEALKSGNVARSHSYSLTYAKKEVNEVSKKLELAKKLWA